MTEPNSETGKVRIKVPAEVAKIMGKWGGRSVKLAAARGALPMSGSNLVMVLFIFCHGSDEELQAEARNTLKKLPAKILQTALAETELHPAALDLIGRLRYTELQIMQKVLSHPQLSLRTAQFLAGQSHGDVLDSLSHNDILLQKSPVLKKMIIQNPAADKAMKLRLGWHNPQSEAEPLAPPLEVANPVVAENGAVAAVDEAGFSEENFEEMDAEIQSKYQKLLDMPVAEKIKMALTGDKEWRTLLIREANKMVCTAVLKNPRISEGEVLAVAKNRSSNDDMIRIVLLNREWLKHYDIKKALVTHPRTPIQKAMRFMNFLSEKDIRELAKSRNVSQAVVNNARRILMNKKH